MIDLVVKQLKTGAWKNVVPFGMPVPSPPYIVVKEEPNPFGKTRFRCILHHNPAYLMDLRSYARKTLHTLLSDKLLAGTAPDTRQIILYEEQDSLTGYTIDSDDGTISIERAYYTPDVINQGV
jgi:hypothetical protein